MVENRHGTVTWSNVEAVGLLYASQIPEAARTFLAMPLFSWFTSTSSKSSATAASARPKQPRKFAAAEIVPCSEGSCNAARETAGTRFLATRVPMLPLQDCDRSICNCTYRRHADRRNLVRRAADLGAAVSSNTLHQAGDHRSAASRGRRSTDPGRR